MIKDLETEQLMMVLWFSDKIRRSRFAGVLAIIGGFLLHLTLGTLYCFGNMNTYITSYLRTHVPGQVRDVEVVWTTSKSSQSSPRSLKSKINFLNYLGLGLNQHRS